MLCKSDRWWLHLQDDERDEIIILPYPAGHLQPVRADGVNYDRYTTPPRQSDKDNNNTNKPDQKLR
jgi:hypothetical protein